MTGDRRDDLADDRDDDMADGADEVAEDATHPRFRERLAEVEDQTIRSRNRKLLGIGAVVALLLLAAASTQSPLFDVDEVRIVGATRTTPDTLRDVAAIDLGTPILGLDTDAAEQRLLALPEVQTASASATWGGVVTIEVNERLPVARIDSDNGVIIVAGDGVVIDVVTTGFLDEAETQREPLPPDLERLPEIAGCDLCERARQSGPRCVDRCRHRGRSAALGHRSGDRANRDHGRLP